MSFHEPTQEKEFIIIPLVCKIAFTTIGKLEYSKPILICDLWRSYIVAHIVWFAFYRRNELRKNCIIACFGRCQPKGAKQWVILYE